MFQKELNAAVADLGQRTSDLENKVDEIASVMNSLKTDYKRQVERMTALNSKTEDLADRSRRRNFDTKGSNTSNGPGKWKILALFRSLI